METFSGANNRNQFTITNIQYSISNGEIMLQHSGSLSQPFFKPITRKLKDWFN